MPSLVALSKVCAGHDHVRILEDLSFDFAEGDSLAVLGRNGVGKSTLLLTIMGLTNLYAGEVLYRGEQLNGVDAHGRFHRGMALVPQEREIFRSLTVEENLLITRRSPLPADRQAAPWTLERVYALFPGLHRRRQNFGDELSGGEQQMLALGRALMGNPTLLLLDEPFEGLAPAIVDQLADAIVQLVDESRISLLLVEHHADLALSMTKRAIVMDRGRISWDGSSQDLQRQQDLLAFLVGLDGDAA